MAVLQLNGRVNLDIDLESTPSQMAWCHSHLSNFQPIHLAHAGNEAADLLAKKATLEGIQNTISITQELPQKETSCHLHHQWDNSDTGRNVHFILPKVKTPPAPWQRPEIMFATGHSPFPTYLKRFILRATDCCGCGKLGSLLQRALNNPLSRIKITD
ncbi:hypothetical protein AVEN_70839-1 [Araneus ventricosus]|uniref:RNase H type-1 domain-containing protein n=1 Tax=Araneus ventricosus TaxID=182803 RepID=A0A4Y2HIM7_ARAVE|nr:hypothetical protein AVEN_70839-1 [Araneus ventricosus]